MNINIELNRRPEDYRLDNCVIDFVEEIDHEQFDTFQNYPTARYGVITNCLHQLPEDTRNERHCIMLLDADGDDGFLVNPHGADYARYSAFVPNARQICRLQRYPSLNEFSSDMEKLVDHFTLEILKNQTEGRYSMSTLDVSEYYEQHFDRFLNYGLFQDMLAERPEFSDVEEYCDELTVTVKPELRNFSRARTISQKELDVICAKHALWLNGAGGERADLSNCILRGLFLCGRDLSHSFCEHAVFDDCNLQSVDFSNAELESARFDKCDMKDMLAIKTNFTIAEFCGCDLSGSSLSQCLMMNTTIQDSKLDNSSWTYCDGEPEFITDDEAEGLSPIL